MDTIGARVRAYRESRGLTQVQFATELDIDQSNLSRLEKRNSGAPLDPQSVPTVEAVAAHMEVAPDTFSEYRAWKVLEIVRTYPALADQVYDLLISLARSAGESNK
jgi:transcriptional regulator with XRE-family HTH domain